MDQINRVCESCVANISNEDMEEQMYVNDHVSHQFGCAKNIKTLLANFVCLLLQMPEAGSFANRVALAFFGLAVFGAHLASSSPSP